MPHLGFASREALVVGTHYPELEHRMRLRLLSDEILHMDQTSTDYQNKRFEIRALGRVAVTRGRDAVDSGHTYTVRSGDTLWGIAQTHLGGGARWTRIMAMNVVELQDPNVIGVGATLKMPQPFAGVVPPIVVTPPTGTVGRGQKRMRDDDDDSESNKNQTTGSPESP